MVSVFYENTRNTSIISTILLCLSVAKELFKIISEEATKQCSLQDNLGVFLFFGKDIFCSRDFNFVYFRTLHQHFAILSKYC